MTFLKSFHGRQIYKALPIIIVTLLLAACNDVQVTPTPILTFDAITAVSQNDTKCWRLRSALPGQNPMPVAVGQSVELSVTPIDGVTTEIRSQNNYQVLCFTTNQAVIPGKYDFTATGKIEGLPVSKDSVLSIFGAELIQFVYSGRIAVPLDSQACIIVKARQNVTQAFVPVTAASDFDLTPDPQPKITISFKDSSQPLCINAAADALKGNYTLRLIGRIKGVGFNGNIFPNDPILITVD